MPITITLTDTDGAGQTIDATGPFKLMDSATAGGRLKLRALCRRRRLPCLAHRLS